MSVQDLLMTLTASAQKDWKHLNDSRHGLNTRFRLADLLHRPATVRWGHSHSVNCTLTDLLPSLPPVVSAHISLLWPAPAYFACRTEVC